MKISALFFAVLLSFVTFTASAEIVNLNKANASALAYYLNGVGEKRAKDIIKYRKDHKKFKKIEEVKQVKGIGEVIFKKIKNNLSLTRGVISAPATITKPKKVKAKKAKSKK